MNLDMNHLREWIGRVESLGDQVTPAPIAALSATLDRDDPPPHGEIRFRRCGIGSIFCRSTASPKSAPTGTPNVAGFFRRCHCRGACMPAGGWSSTVRCMSETRSPSFAHCRRQPQARAYGRAGLRARAARDQRRRWPGADGGAGSRLPRKPAGWDRSGSEAAGRAGRCRLDARDRSGRRAAVPLFGADVQRPSNPLRPPVCAPRSKAIPDWWCTVTLIATLLLDLLRRNLPERASDDFHFAP